MNHRASYCELTSPVSNATCTGFEAVICDPATTPVEICQACPAPNVFVASNTPFEFRSTRTTVPASAAMIESDEYSKNEEEAATFVPTGEM